MDTRRSLDALLARARDAEPNERIELRDAIAQHGDEAIQAVREWLSDPEMWRFAVRVIGRASAIGSRTLAIEALHEAAGNGSPAQRADIDEELRRLGAPEFKRSGAFGPIDEEAIRDRLILAARKGELVYYSDLARATGREMKGPHWAVHIGRILGRISDNEVAEGRPMLSAIVVTRDTKMPGEGFFNLGRELHVVQPGEDESHVCQPADSPSARVLGAEQMSE
jgi:hypothetical protein